MASSLTPAQRSLRARLGAHALHAAGGTNTAPAREKFNERFLDEVDPDRVLSEDERDRRAEHARRRYFTELAYRSSRARAVKSRRPLPPVDTNGAEAEAA